MTLEEFLYELEGHIAFVDKLCKVSPALAQLNAHAALRRIRDYCISNRTLSLPQPLYEAFHNYVVLIEGLCAELPPSKKGGLSRKDYNKLVEDYETLVEMERAVLSAMLDVPQEQPRQPRQQDRKTMPLPPRDEEQAAIQELRNQLGSDAPHLNIREYEQGKDYWKALNELVGLSMLKDEFASILDFYEKEVIRMTRKGREAETPMLNFVFKGNPGTGKTTVARLIAGILKSKGLIERGQCVEVDSSGLVGRYVGHSAPQTKLAYLEALGGVLFIDEAYSLSKHSGTSSDFGAEVVDTLTALMENYRGRTVVILAGYDKEMTEFLNATNTGFKSRFSSTLHFQNYNAEEMMSIFRNMAKSSLRKISSEADANIMSILKTIEKNSHKINGFANARTVRSLFETIARRANNRGRKNDRNLGDITFADTELTAVEFKNVIGI